VRHPARDSPRRGPGHWPRNVVYVATEDEGRFQERTVRLGAAAGDTVEVLEGLSAGSAS
jgi:multidrug efflux pump subunit AcrA (membrane-fusion protein)